MTFSIVDSGVFLTAPASFISAKDKNLYILAYLCSEVGKYFIYKNSDTTGAGDIMLNIQSLIRFPIPQDARDGIAELCESMITTPTELTQQTLNTIIYQSYGFNENEIKEIERY